MGPKRDPHHLTLPISNLLFFVGGGGGLSFNWFATRKDRREGRREKQKRKEA